MSLSSRYPDYSNDDPLTFGRTPHLSILEHDWDNRMHSTKLESQNPTMERMFPTKQALVAEDIPLKLEEPKKGNILQNMYNSFMSMIGDWGTQIPNPISNNTLSVTVVDTEGIISPDFFKSLTQSNDLTTEGSYVKNVPSAPSLESLQCDDLIDMTLNDEQFIINKEQDMDKETVALQRVFSQNNLLNTMDPFIQPIYSESSADVVDHVAGFGSCMEIETQATCDTSSSHVIEQPPQPNTMDDLQAPQKIILNVQEIASEPIQTPQQSTSESEDFEIPSKPRCSPSMRKKSKAVSVGRGRGRGKAKLQSSGLSQKRNLKERSRHHLLEDIKDDVNALEESEFIPEDNYDDNLSITSDNSSLSGQDYYEHSPIWSVGFAFSDQNSKKRKQKKIRYSETYYIKDTVIEKETEKLEFGSESSDDESDDSDCDWIVFQNESEDSDDEFQHVAEKVRFNLKPVVHHIICWSYAYRAARQGCWLRPKPLPVRKRNKSSIDVSVFEKIIGPILSQEHRDKVWNQRFKDFQYS